MSFLKEDIVRKTGKRMRYIPSFHGTMNRSVVIQKLETKAKRKIIISDIHGNLDLYQALLKKSTINRMLIV